VSDIPQIIVMVILLIGVYLLTQVVVGWRIRRAGAGIIKDLERRKALDPATAVELPYAQPSLFRIGMRDFRPKSLAALVQGEIVGQTASGKYYLKKRPHELNL
jgi:hypothetical protein